MDDEKPQFSLAPNWKTRARSREVQLLVDIVEPDPNMQPWFLSDLSTLNDVGGHPPDLISRRLVAYFGRPVQTSIDLPLWQLIDSLKEEFPGWPDDLPPEEPGRG